MEHCEILRWQVIKNSLNNLSLDAFLEGYKKNEDAICLDVRTQSEYDMWHLPHAINIDYLSKNLADELEGLSPSKTYYIYCRTSRRSMRVCQLLKNSNFKNIFHLKDGVKDVIGNEY